MRRLEAQAGPAPAPRQVRVLLVEDHPDLSHAIRMALEGRFEVTPARDGQEALEILAQLRPAELPQVILCDLMMPRLDGWELRQALLDNALWASIPMVVMSAWPGDDERARSLDGFLRKPFELEDLVTTLQRCALVPPES